MLEYRVKQLILLYVYWLLVSLSNCFCPCTFDEVVQTMLGSKLKRVEIVTLEPLLFPCLRLAPRAQCQS